MPTCFEHLPQGAKIWEQPPLEGIIEGMRGLSPGLHEAPPERRLRLLATAVIKSPHFSTVANELGVTETGDRQGIRHYVSEVE